jgi:hypothetical protein
LTIDFFSGCGNISTIKGKFFGKERKKKKRREEKKKMEGKVSIVGDPVQTEKNKRIEAIDRKKEYPKFVQQIDPIIKKYGWWTGYDSDFYGGSAMIVFYDPPQKSGFTESPGVSYQRPTVAPVVLFDWRKKVIKFEFQIGDIEIDRAGEIFSQFKKCSEEISEKTGYEVVIK